MENEYTEEVKGVVLAIAQKFIREIKGTPMHGVKARLGKRRGVLDLLVQGRILQIAGECYYPCFLALQFLDVKDQSYARDCTTYVLQTLKQLYASKGPKEYSYNDVRDAATRMLGSRVDAQMVEVGTLMAADFTSYVAKWRVAGNEGVESVTVREGIADFESLDAAWSEEETKRNSAVAQLGFVERSYPIIPEVGSPPEVVSSTGGEHMANRADWEQIERLGGGGQSDVFLVRRPARAKERAAAIQEILRSSPWPNVDPDARDRSVRFAEAVWKYARPDNPTELGALKVFKLRDEGPEAEEHAVDRLKSEVSILGQKRPGLPQLLDASEPERWMVTEFLPEGTLEKHTDKYKRQPPLALKAFRSLVETVASLHKENIVHRDIKPANVFIRQDNQLVLGDFGIVYLPDQADRVTRTGERVGPRDYMPQWADLGQRHENVHTNFDVYMLGKLLWCMVAGRLKLPREYYKKPEFNLTEMFPNDPDMHIINSILGRCVVEEPRDCLESAQQLLPIVDEHLAILQRGGQLLSDGVPRPCRVCGKGHYKLESLPQGTVGQSKIDLSMAGKIILLRLFICDVCGHVELFK